MTTIESFFATARRLGPRMAWRHGTREFSWTEAAEKVRATARALIALGVKPGECVNIVGPNRPEWLMADLGAIAAGAVPAPIYPTLTAEQARYIATHSESKVAIVGDASQREKLRGTQIREFVLMDEMGAFQERGSAVPEAEL